MMTTITVILVATLIALLFGSWWYHEKNTPSPASGKKRAFYHRFLDHHRLVFVAVMVAFFWILTLTSTLGLAELLISGVEKGISEVLADFKLPEFQFTGSMLLSIYLAVVVTLYVVKMSCRWFFVYVPEFMALITVDHFDGAFRKLLTGLHLKYPWERVNKGMWFILEIISVDFEGTFPTRDGGVVKVKGNFRYQADVNLLEQYAEVDETTIGNALINDAKRVLTEQLLTAHTANVSSKLPLIREQIRISYEGINKLEGSLGVKFHDIAIGSLEFEKKTQETLDAQLQMKTVLGKCKTDTQRRAAMILLDKKGVTMSEDVIRLEAEGGLKGADPTVLAALAAILKK